MSLVRKLDARIHGALLFPASNLLLNRRGIPRMSRSLAGSQWTSSGELRDLQLQRLQRVLVFAGKHVPYYRALFERIGCAPGDIRSLQDLARIPPLGRDDIIRDAASLVDERLHAAVRVADSPDRPPGKPLSFAVLRRHRLVRNTSSGSTGWPTVFYDDGTRSAVSWAHELRLRSWYGVQPGAREARLVLPGRGSGTTSHSGRFDARRLLWNQMLLPGTLLSEREYAVIAQGVRRFQPEVLWGYTPALVGFAQYLEAAEQRAPGLSIQPRLVITWAAPLYEHERATLERAFRRPVTNIYGSREVGHVSAICPHGSMHVNQENLIVEVEQSADGVAGELLVTTLDASPMPFIRYRMGDLGILSDAGCSCGRGLQVIRELVGRTGEVFVTKDGRMISPNVWCRLFMAPELTGAVRRFQVVYTRSRDIKVRIERGTRFSADTDRTLRAALAERFHPGTATTLEYVQEILPQVSGKYQMVVHEEN